MEESACLEVLMIDFQFSEGGQSMWREGVGLDCREGGREAVRSNETKENGTWRSHTAKENTVCVFKRC